MVLLVLGDEIELGRQCNARREEYRPERCGFVVVLLHLGFLALHVQDGWEFIFGESSFQILGYFPAVCFRRIFFFGQCIFDLHD